MQHEFSAILYPLYAFIFIIARRNLPLRETVDTGHTTLYNSLSSVVLTKSDNTLRKYKLLFVFFVNYKQRRRICKMEVMDIEEM
jgi:hypothetical protein